MIDRFDANMIAEELTIALKALKKLHYCASLGAIQESLIDRCLGTAHQCMQNIYLFIDKVKELEASGQRGINERTDGRRKYDYAALVEAYKKCHNASAVARKFGCSRDTVTEALKKWG